MERETIEQIIQVLDRGRVEVLDLTGSAPEMNPHFRDLVRRPGPRRHRDRPLQPDHPAGGRLSGSAGIPGGAGCADRGVAALLPGRERQRAARQGRLQQQLEAIRRLNAVGYGDPALPLDLVYNPVGTSSAAAAGGTEADTRELDRASACASTAC